MGPQGPQGGTDLQTTCPPGHPPVVVSVEGDTGEILSSGVIPIP